MKKRQFMGVAEKKAPLTTTHELFLKRVREEMKQAGLVKKDGTPNVNALAQRVGAPPQTTLNDIMRGADPRLEAIHQIATALSKQVWQLLKESADERRENVTNVKKFPQPRRMIRKKPKTAIKKADDKIKTGG